MTNIFLLRKYLRFLKPYGPLLISGSILLIVWTLINLVPPWLIKILIDDALPRQDLWLLNTIVFIQLFIVFNNQFINSLQGFIFTYIGQRLNLDLQVHVFNHLLTLPITFFNTNETGGLVHRFTQDIPQLRDLIASILVSLFVNTVILVMLFTILIFINWKLALIAILIAFLYGLNANIFKNRIYGSAKDIGEKTGDLYSILYQVIPGIREIKSLRASSFICRKYTGKIVEFFRAIIKNFHLGVYVGLLSSILPPLAWAIIIGVGGREVIQGTLSVGSLLAFVNYLDKIYGPIQSLSGLYSEMQRTVPAMERISKILEVEPEFNTSKGKRLSLSETKGHIVFKSVSFGYIKEKPVLNNIDIDIPAGKKIAFVGPSGCGKSTLAHLLVRFFDVSSGSIYLDGYNIKQFNLSDYRKHVGLVPQGIRLFNASIKENILMGNRHASDEEIVNAAKFANIHERISELSQGYDTLYGERGIWLSGGETQRIVIARAILQNPRVLILDEATSSVDANSEYLIHDSIQKISKEKTLVVIAHRFSSIIDADWIYVIENGHIMGQGTHQMLLAQNELYTSLYLKQIQEGSVTYAESKNDI